MIVRIGHNAYNPRWIGDGQTKKWWSDLFQLSTQIVGMICIYSSLSSILIILGVVQMQLVFRPWNH